MFNLICVFIVALIGGVGLLFSIEEVNIAGIVILCISGVWLFVSFLNNLVCYTSQIEKFEDIRGSLKKLDITKEKQTHLMSEFKLYLADKYPELEKEIFHLITESKSDIHVILNYPELKSSETLLSLVDQINKLANEVYSYKYSLESEYSKVRFYNLNMWFYLKPQIPEYILKLL